jgi:3D (Asp-Asp-Asp) domain-containing protein
MARAISRPARSDFQVLRDPRRSQPIHLTYVMLGFLVSGLLAPIFASPRVWKLASGRLVYLSVDGQVKSYTSVQPTVAGVLRESKIPLGPGDRVTPGLKSQLWGGIQITVVRAVPLTINVLGDRRQVRLAATTVADALGLAGVELAPGDSVSPGLGTPLAPRMEIAVERWDTRMRIERLRLPFADQTVMDADLFKGRRVVRAAGQQGLHERTMRVEYVNGRPASFAAVSDITITPPVPRIIAIGTKPVLELYGPFAGKEVMTLEATAYYPGPNNFGGGVGPTTAIGILARRGVVAVDPSVIRLGSRVHVEGYGEAVAGDTGGAIRGNRIDLCFDTYEQAMQFGRRTVKVHILSQR